MAYHQGSRFQSSKEKEVTLMQKCGDCKFHHQNVDVVLFHRPIPTQERGEEFGSSFIKDFCTLRWEPVLGTAYKVACNAGKPKENGGD